MADLKKCAVAPNGDIITPEGRMSFADDCHKGKKNEKGEMRYPLSMLFPPGSDLKLLKKKMFDVAMTKVSGDDAEKTAKAKKYVEDKFLDPVEKNAGAEFEGWTLLRLTAAKKPGFIFANGKDVSSDDYDTEIYSGRWARVSSDPFWFDVKTNKGVAVGLQNVQLLRHDDPIGGAKPRASDQFEAGEGAADSPDDMFDDSASGSDEDPFA